MLVSKRVHLFEDALQTLITKRMGEYRQAVNIASMTKSSLQESDYSLLPLMEMTRKFLIGRRTSPADSEQFRSWQVDIPPSFENVLW